METAEFQSVSCPECGETFSLIHAKGTGPGNAHIYEYPSLKTILSKATHYTIVIPGGATELPSPNQAIFPIVCTCGHPTENGLVLSDASETKQAKILKLVGQP